MTGGLVREPSPEEQELQLKQAQLHELEARLAERELELATFQAELHNFEHQYLQVVGIRQQELQRIEAQIEEYTTYLANTYQFKPSVELKQLYRQVAKAIHPDLATDPEERQQREALMAEVNRAYEAGDEQKLQALLDGWASSPHAVEGDDIAASLMRTLRKIAQSQHRLTLIEHQLTNLEKTDIFRLQLRAKHADAGGRDLLSEMARELDRQIQAAQAQLQELKAKAG